MKGLLLKDLYSYMCYKKQFLIILAIWLVIVIFSPSFSTSMSIMVIIFLTQPAIGLFRFDEASKWEAYAASLPLPRAHIVLSRYISGILPGAIATPICFLFSFIVGFFTHQPNYLSINISTMLVGLVMYLLAICFSFPVAFRWGAEVAQRVMTTLFLFVFGLFIIFILFLKNASLPSTTILIAAAALSLVLIFTVSITSVKLSQKWYQAKEL